MSGVTDYRILDILELEPVSNRLRNAVNEAYQRGNMPCDTVFEYSRAKEEMVQRLHRLPRIGKKTITELIGLLDKYSQGMPGATPNVSSKLSIPEAVKSVSIVTFISSLNCSVRLENALAHAIERHEFSAEKLGDLDGKRVHVLKSDLRRVKNLGRKSIEEFLDLLATMSRDSAESVDSKTGVQSEFRTQSNKANWVSDYLSLLEKERYDCITVVDLVSRMPGRSKIEDKLLKALNQECPAILLYELLTNFSGEPHEISSKLINDEKLSRQLASLIMVFYQFLTSKSYRKFSSEEYFENDFSTLNKKQSKVLLARCGADKLTLEELGKELGVTRERVRQIEAKALMNYIKANRVGLLHLSENLEKYVKASKGVLSVNVIKKLYGISRIKLEAVLSIIVSNADDSWIARDGEYIISQDFKSRKNKMFGKIEASIYSQAARDMKVTFQGIDGVNSQIVRYFLFVHDKKFSVNASGEIEFVMSSASERARTVLAIAGQPIHTSNAARLYKTIFQEDVTEHTLAATLGRLPDGLIVAPGTYALYSHLRLNSDDIDFIRDETYQLIRSAGRYLSSRVVFEHINRLRPDFRLKEPFFNYHLVLGALQDDERYQTKRGFMVGLTSFGDHLPLETEVEEIVEKHGPVSISEVIELLRPTRGELTNGSVRNTLVASNEIFLTSEKRKWDVAERVFKDTADIRRLQIAIRMAAYKSTVALSSIYNRVRSTGIEYALGTILSIVWKDPDITLEGGCVRFDGTDNEIERYYASCEPTTLWQLDYRNHTDEKSVDTGMLDALVKEFDLYV